jgi:hypothetical protein
MPSSSPRLRRQCVDDVIEDAQIEDVGAIAELRGRLLAMRDAAAASTARAARCALEAVAEAGGEVERRRAALNACPRDRDPTPLRNALEKAVSAFHSLDLATTQALNDLRTLRTQTDEISAEASSYLSRLQASLLATPSAPPASLSSGTSHSPFGMHADRRPGHPTLAAGGPAFAAVKRYSERGGELNKALWIEGHGGPALDADMAAWRSAMDHAFDFAEPTSRTLILYRSATPEILRDLGVVDASGAAERELTPGPTTKHSGFLSASTSDPYRDAKGYRVHMRITVPAGTPILDLRPTSERGTGLSPHTSEHELLLPRAGYLVVSPGTARTVRAPTGETHVFFDAYYITPPRYRDGH